MPQVQQIKAAVGDDQLLAALPETLPPAREVVLTMILSRKFTEAS